MACLFTTVASRIQPHTGMVPDQLTVEDFSTMVRVDYEWTLAQMVKDEFKSGQHYEGSLKLTKEKKPKKKSKANRRLILTALGKNALASRLPGHAGRQYCDYAMAIFQHMTQCYNQMFHRFTVAHGELMVAHNERSVAFNARLEDYMDAVLPDVNARTPEDKKRARGVLLSADKTSYKNMFHGYTRGAREAVRDVQGLPAGAKVSNASLQFNQLGKAVDTVQKLVESTRLRLQKDAINALPTEVDRKRAARQILSTAREQLKNSGLLHHSDDPRTHAQTLILPRPVKRLKMVAVTAAPAQAQALPAHAVLPAPAATIPQA
jgi:hypothetical protein